MKNKNLTSLDQFIDKQIGRRGAKRRKKFESDYEAFKLHTLAASPSLASVSISITFHL